MNLTLRHERIGPLDTADRLRIAHLSDFHLWCSDRLLRAVEPLLAAARPDVLALTGDYADTPAGQRRFETWARRMAARYPLCWIAGNHDRWWGEAFIRRLEALPHAYAIDRHDAWIANRSGRRFRFTSWHRLTHGDRRHDRDEPTVALLHDPAEAKPNSPSDSPPNPLPNRFRQPDQIRNRAHCILLAGHLHGGQINLWRDRHGAPYPASFLYRWVAERDTLGGVPVVVSRGLGDTLPLRLGAPREVVLVDFGAAITERDPSRHRAATDTLATTTDATAADGTTGVRDLELPAAEAGR